MTAQIDQFDHDKGVCIDKFLYSLYLTVPFSLLSGMGFNCT